MISDIEILLDESENYIQINDGNESALRNAWPQIVSSYPGHEVVFCYHNNESPVGFMTEIGAEILDDCIEMRVPSREITPTPPHITRVTEDNFDTFALFHDKHMEEGVGNWTSRRLKQAFGDWCIFMSLADGQINGYTTAAMWYPNQTEIYCIVAPDLETGKALAAAAVNHTFEVGKAEVLFMADRDSLEKEIALELGFEIKGYYVGYSVVLPGEV